MTLQEQLKNLSGSRDSGGPGKKCALPEVKPRVIVNFFQARLFKPDYPSPTNSELHDVCIIMFKTRILKEYKNTRIFN